MTVEATGVLLAVAGIENDVADLAGDRGYAKGELEKHGNWKLKIERVKIERVMGGWCWVMGDGLWGWIKNNAKVRKKIGICNSLSREL